MADSRVRTIETVLIFLLLIGGLITRFSDLQYPREVVFDEVHFGKFVNAYCCTGEHFFDIHPPHGKLLIAAAVAATSYTGTFPFTNIGDPYTDDVPVFAFRIIPALAGALLPLLIYVLLRQLGVTPATSILGGVLILSDNALIVQSRLISLDSILALATFGSLSAYLAGLKHLARQIDAKRYPRRAWLWFLAAGALAGLAAGTKITGLAALGLISIACFVLLIRSLWVRKPKFSPAAVIVSGLIILSCASLVYGVGWAIHNKLQTAPGSGDAFYSREASLVAKHKVMFSANYGLSATHPYASRWYTWPIMQRPVFYWQEEGARIYFLGNPVVWWGATLILVIGLLDLIRRYARGDSLKQPQADSYQQFTAWSIPLVGFAMAFWPLIRVPRPLFLYHYVTPLIFSLLFGLVWIDAVSRNQKKLRRVMIGIALVALATGVFFSPLTYGYEVPGWWEKAMVWLPTWR